jgi:hypothetical protein
MRSYVGKFDMTDEYLRYFDLINQAQKKAGILRHRPSNLMLV